MTSVADVARGVVIEVIGPAGSVYGLRAPTGNSANCRQRAGATDRRASPGPPENSVDHTAVTCGDTTSRQARANRVTVTTDIGRGFTADYDVSVTPPR